MSSHKKRRRRRNEINNKNMLTFHVKIDIRKYLQKKERKEKPKTKQREYLYLVVCC
jgi:hypothetical protein